MKNTTLLTAALAAFAVSVPAAALAGPAKVSTVEITVTEDGFTPARVTAKNGEPLRLVVTRTTDRTCATSLVVKELGIQKKLPLGKPVVVELTPKKAGEVRFACPMDMIAGAIVVVD
jgi:plastocyanin domain-containing protein